MNDVWFMIGALALRELKRGNYATVAHMMRRAAALDLIGDWRTCILVHYDVRWL